MPKFFEVTGPAEFASYFVNGDASGLTGEGKRAADAFLDALLADNGTRIISTTDAEPRFTNSFRLYGGQSDAGDVIDYIATSTDGE